MTTYPPCDSVSIADLSGANGDYTARPTGCPDESAIELELASELHHLPPPGWEDDMAAWDLERAEREVETAHGERAAEAAAFIRRQIPIATHVFVGRERTEHFHADGRRLVAWRYTVSFLLAPAAWYTGVADTYDEAARAAVANAVRAAKGAA